MNSVLTIAENMLIDRIINNKFSMTIESKIKNILIIFSSLMSFLSIGFFVYSGYIWLSNNYEIMNVMFAMGVIFFVISMVSGMIIYTMSTYKRKKIQEEKDNFIAIAKEAFEIFLQELEAPANDNPKTAILIASISGYLAGERFL